MPAEYQVGLGLRGRGVVRPVSVAPKRVEGGPSELARAVRIARDEAERGGVHRRVPAAGARVDSRVQLGRARRGPAALRALAAKSDVLDDARPQGRHVLGIDIGQPELAKAPRGLVRRAGACQREHRPVPEPEIVRVLFEATLREIEGGEQLSTPLGVADGFGPFDGRTLGHSSLRPYLRPTAPVKEARTHGPDVSRGADAGRGHRPACERPRAAPRRQRRALPRGRRRGLCVIVLLAGRAKLTVPNSSGREVIVAVRGPGDLLGELAALVEAPRSATVATIEPVDALIMSGSELASFLERNSRVALVILRMVAERLLYADLQQAQFATHDVVGRVAHRLVELTERFGVETEEGIVLDVPLSQEELRGLDRLVTRVGQQGASGPPVAPHDRDRAPPFHRPRRGGAAAPGGLKSPLCEGFDRALWRIAWSARQRGITVGSWTSRRRS